MFVSEIIFIGVITDTSWEYYEILSKIRQFLFW